MLVTPVAIFIVANTIQLTLEESLVNSRGQITQDLISLYKALGGGISM